MMNNIAVFLLLATATITSNVNAALTENKKSIRTRDLTECDTLKSCYFVNIKTREEYLLGGDDTFLMDEDNRGYSIRCDVNGIAGTESDYIKFIYNEKVHEEFGLPRYMNGDSGSGSYINKVPYLSTCGRKEVVIEGHVWSNICFTENYYINLLNPDGTCDIDPPSLPTPTRTPIQQPVQQPVCNNLKACFLVNLQTRVETLLDGEDTYMIDPANPRGYSVRCDLMNEYGAATDYVKFLYDGREQKEYGTTQTMNGDSYQGQYINPVPYLASCGVKLIDVELSLGSKLCASREYLVTMTKSDGSCSSPTSAPIKKETPVPVPVPVITPTHSPTTAPIQIAVPTPVPLSVPIPTPQVPSPVIAPIAIPNPNCDTLKRCYIVNINTRDEYPLEEYNMYVLDPTNTVGYSVRCDMNGDPGKQSDYIKFSYDDIFKFEFGTPRYMNGDNDGGKYIYKVPYLSTCGLKRFSIEAALGLDICFKKDFVIVILNADGNCDTPIAPISAPIWAPVPTSLPNLQPVSLPTKPPTQIPTTLPTQSPTAKPTKQPTDAPTELPTDEPTSSPTDAPTELPTDAPTDLPTETPSDSPTNLSSFACALPPKTNDFSIISLSDAIIGAGNMKKGISIGGTLFDSTPTESGAIDTTTSLVGDLDDNSAFYFNGGVTFEESLPLETSLHFLFLATNAVNTTLNGFKVIVIGRGGEFNSLDFIEESTGWDHGKTLVIFNTPDDITLIPTSTGGAFGPSLIAPFSKVLIRSDVGFVDGFIVGKRIETVGAGQSSIIFVGDGYTGPLTCN